MTTGALALEIEMLSKEEADAIWHKNAKRASNYGAFLAMLNTREVGDSWSIAIATKAAEQNMSDAEYAKAIRYNFNEAAGNRVAWLTIAEPEVVKDGDKLTTKDNEIVTLKDGVYKVERKQPVRLNWKTDSHTEEREVTDEKGRKGKTTVTVIDRLKVIVVASEVRHRAARTPRETVTVANPPADAQTGATVTLPDGRTAKLGKNGKWTAAKQSAAPASTSDAASAATQNGVVPANSAPSNDAPMPATNGTPQASEISTPEPATARAGRNK